MMLGLTRINNLQTKNNILFQKRNKSKISNNNNGKIYASSLNLMPNYNKAKIVYTKSVDPTSNKNILSLHKHGDNDILESKAKIGNDKKMSLYSTITKREFSIDTQAKQDFNKAIDTYMAIGKEGLKPDDDTIYNFHMAFNKAMSEVQNNDDVDIDYLTYMLCSLLECMDKSKSKSVTEGVDYCLFMMLIPKYKNNKQFKEITEQILSSVSFNNKFLKAIIENAIDM